MVSQEIIKVLTAQFTPNKGALWLPHRALAIATFFYSKLFTMQTGY
jgi:hypothetical protein